MRPALLALLLCACHPAPAAFAPDFTDEVMEAELSPDSGTGGSEPIHRSREVVRAFMHAHPCPGGVDKGSTARCRGWVVDHRAPLCAGGPDAVENLAWQEVEAAHQKDWLEDWVCRHGGVRNP
jgi:hypothetical protein